MLFFLKPCQFLHATDLQVGLPTKHVGPSLFWSCLQAQQIAFLDAILLDRFYFSERLESKPLTESTIILKQVKSIAFHCVLCHIPVAIGHNRMCDLR